MAKLLTPKEAADVLRLTEEQVKRYIALGTLPVVRIGKVARIEAEALERFIKEQVKQ